MGRVRFTFARECVRLLAPIMIVGAAVFVVPAVSATRYEGGSYIIDASVANSFGGSTGGGSYKMVSSGGEAIVGNGAGGSYKMGAGYVAQLAEDEKVMKLNVQPADVEVYYSLDEGAGTVAGDGSVNAFDGVLTNGPTWGDSGKINGHITLNGIDQYVSIGDKPSLDINAGQVQTFSFWMKAGVQASTRSLLWKNGSCIGWDFVLQSNGLIAVQMGTGNNGCTGYTQHYLHTDNITAGTRYDDNQWHHVAAVIDRSNGVMLLYVDGVKKGERAVDTTSSGDGNGNFRMGTNWNNTTVLNGSLDEVKIFNRALSEQELLAEYEAQSNGSSSVVTLPVVTPGVSQNSSVNAMINTNAAAYSVAVSQSGDLTNGTDTINAVLGTVGSPSAWSEGSTKGLGFTLTAGPDIPVAWGTDPNFNYAAIPGSSTTFYNRSGYTGEAHDLVTIQYRLDTPSSQPASQYTNTVTYTATMLP